MAATDQLHPDDRPPDPTAKRGIPRGLLWALALAVVVLTIASWVALSNDQRRSDDGVVHLNNNGVAPGLGPAASLVDHDAPGFSLPTLTGGNVNLSDLRGKVVVVNFWQSACTPCVGEMPMLESTHQQYGDKVEFVGVATADVSQDAAKAMVAKTGVTYASGYDAAGQVATSFGTSSLPATYVIDSNGIVRFQYTVGAVPHTDLTAALDKLTR